MNRNEMRTGVPSVQSAPEPPKQFKDESSELSFICPTEFVDLPSNGSYYSEGSTLHGIDSIELKEMTAKEEDILVNKSLLQKGVAIDRVINSLMVDKSINTDELLVGDKDALIIAIRKASYGSEYKVKITCPNCGTSCEQEYDLNNVKVKQTYSFDEANLCEQDNNIRKDENNFIVHLPKLKIDVTVKLLNGNDQKQLQGYMEHKRKNKIPEATLTDYLKSIIVSINGKTDSSFISKVLDALPASDSRYLRTVYVKLVPGMDMSFLFTCETCQNQADVEVPLTAEFFWPRS